MTTINDAVSQEALRLHAFMDALSAHEGLEDYHRVELYELYEALPYYAKDYDYRSDYARSWERMGGVPLGTDRSSLSPFPRTVTLDSASGFADRPTKATLLLALARAAKQVGAR